MANETDDSDSFWKWALAAGAGAAAWALWKHHRANDPDALEAEAQKILSRDFNPFSSEDLDTQTRALGMLDQARRLREYGRQAAEGAVSDRIDREMRGLIDDMSTENFRTDRLGDGGFLEQMNRFAEQVQRGTEQFGHPQPSHAHTCPQCQGAGGRLCGRCHGFGRNRAVPYPQMTGNEAVDAVLALRYQQDATCPICQGQGQLICAPCGGSGRI